MRKEPSTRAWRQPLVGLLERLKTPWQTLGRQSELVGTLVELDPGNAAYYDGSLPPAGWIGVRLWRFWRRFLHDIWHILSLTLGAGLVSGALLGLLRGLLAINSGMRVGVVIAMSFFYTFVLGAATAFGMSLSESVFMRPQDSKEKPPPFWRVPWQVDRRAELLAVGLGALFFGTAHIATAWANDVFGNPQYPRGLMAPAGYLVGLGLSLALYGMPKAGMRQNATRWFLRLVVAASFSVLAQMIVFAAGQDWSAITLTYTGSDISDLFGWSLPISQWVTAHALMITLADAAFVGVSLVAGISLGLTIAERLYNQWQAAVNRVQD